jgi:hypothetical protein
MHDYYGHTEKFRDADDETLRELLKFRIAFLDEELRELHDAKTAEDVVDALIDIIVVAIGTLHAFDVDGKWAWDEVLRANLSKENGVKATRPNPLGLPDLVKPDGWKPPSHHGNHGSLARIFD